MIAIVLYAVIGLLSALTAQVIGKVWGLRDEVMIVLYPLLAGLFWPVAVPITMVVFLIRAMDKWADRIADRFRK